MHWTKTKAFYNTVKIFTTFIKNDLCFIKFFSGKYDDDIFYKNASSGSFLDMILQIKILKERQKYSLYHLAPPKQKRTTFKVRTMCE